jgi:hypothetical protein
MGSGIDHKPVKSRKEGVMPEVMFGRREGLEDVEHVVSRCCNAKVNAVLKNGRLMCVCEECGNEVLHVFGRIQWLDGRRPLVTDS